jgi:hypothetical protein
MAVNVENLILQAKRDGFGQTVDYYKISPTTAAAGHYSLWQSTGNPAAGSYTGTRAATQLLRTTQGALGPVSNAASGKKLFANAATARASNAVGTLTIWDALLYYAACDHTINTLQNMTNAVALPRYTTGEGVHAFLDTTTGLGATAQTVQIGYTNSAGTPVSGRTSVAHAIQASSVQGRICHGLLTLPLQSGDSGITSVQTIQFSAANTTGASALVLAKRLFSIPMAGTNVDGEFDAVLRRDLPQIQEDACLFATWSAGTTASAPNMTGFLDLVSLPQ